MAREGEPTPEVMLLLYRAAGYARHARSADTIRAYRSDWSHFENWCERHGLTTMPANPRTVAAYLADLGDLADHYRPSTMSRRPSSISIAHQQLGHSSPTTDPRVRTVAQDVRRTLSTAVRSVCPLSIGYLRMMVAHTPTDVLGLRDRAMLLVGHVEWPYRRSRGERIIEVYQ